MEHLSFSFGTDWVLKDLSFFIKPGEFVFLVGPSGAGKTTLLKVLHGSLPLKRGKGVIAGFDLKTIKKRSLPRLRREVSIVFQDFKILPEKTVFENISLPLQILGLPSQQIQKRVSAILRILDMENKQDYKCSELSGGQQQKVAIGRAVIIKPKVILADEPTGSIDAEAGMKVMELFKHFNRYGTTIFIATHSTNLASSIKNARIIKIKDGKIEQDG